MAFQAGVAYVPVIPSLRGFQREIARVVGVSGREAGRQFSDAFGREVERGAPSIATRLRSGLGRLNTVMAGVGVAGGAALSAALVKGLDVSRAQGMIRAQLDLTAAESERIGAVAGRLYARAYGDSMDDVRAAIVRVIQDMDGMRTASNETLEQTAARALTVAKVLDEDVGRVTSAVTNLLRTGLAKSSAEAFDILTKGAQIGANRTGDLLDTFEEYAVQFQQLGFTGQQALGLINQMLQSGARNTDLAADALKEFIIEAAAGGNKVVGALKEMGLNADDLVAKFAAGGPQSAQAFDLVMRTLRGIEDPLKRNQIAVDLFGTKAEDVQRALLALDPSTATRGLDGLAGATDRAGQAMQETAGAKVESFKRSLEQNVTNLLAESVIPKLEELGRTASSLGITPAGIVTAGGALLGLAAAYKTVALGARIATAQIGRFSIANAVATSAKNIAGFVTGLRNVGAAFASNATLGTRLGAALRSQIMLWRQQAAAAGVSTGRIIAHAAAQRIAAAATRVWAGAQRLLNAVMRANPIVLVATALGLLVAGLVVAYKRSETFRNIVQSAWGGIQSAVSTAWGFIQPILNTIWGFITGTLVPIFQQLWSVVQNCWNGILTAVQTAWSFIQPIFSFIVSVIRGVLQVAFIVLLNTVKIAWIGIQIAIKAGWAIIRGIFTLIKAFITNILAPAFKWLYNNSVKPGWEQIKKMIAGAWNFIRPIWERIKSWLTGTLADAFRSLRSAAQTAWDRLRSGISSVWNNGIKPVFDRLKQAVGAVKSAFSAAVNGIKEVWGRLRDIAKKPVNFVIGLYNNGIVRLVNRIADFAGIDTRLKEIPKFATGDVVPGYAPGRDRVLAAVTPGESIFRPEFTRAVGARWVHTANAIARRKGPSAVRRWLMRGGDKLGGEGIAFSRGGIVPGFAGFFSLGGIVKNFLGGLKNFAFKNVERAFRGVLDKIMGGIPGSGVLRDVIAALPKRLIDYLVTWFKGKVGLGGGPSFQRALTFARAQAGKPYSWGGVGPNGYDCSGFMSAILNVIEGKNPYQRRFTTFSFTGAQQGPAGFVRNKRSAFEVGVTNRGVGHMAGTLLGTPVESRGSAGVVVGAGARGADHALFDMRYGLVRDQGGPIPPGTWLVHNGTGRAEWVLTERQVQALASGVAPKAGARRRGVIDLRRGGFDLLGPTPAPPSAAQKALQAIRDLITQLTKGLPPAAERLNDLLSQITKQIKSGLSGRTEKRALQWVQQLQSRLADLSSRAQQVASRIAEAIEYAGQVTDQAREYASVQSIGATTAQGLLRGLTSRADEVGALADAITELQRRGLGGGLLRQIIGLGTREGLRLARQLLAAPSLIPQLNAAQAAIDEATDRLGKTAADALYDAGAGAAKGFLTGLYRQQARLDQMFDDLAKKFGDRLLRWATPSQSQPRVLQPGPLTLVGGQAALATAAPGRVLSDAQWAAVSAGTRGGDGAAVTYNIYPRQAVMTVADLDRLTRVQEARARVGRPR